MRKAIFIDVLFFVLGLTYMYFDSQEYYTKKLEQQKKFYTVSKCSTKAGCDFLDTVTKLHDLNKEREELKEKSEALDEEVKLLMGSPKAQ